jgi:hypothetical protein
MTEQFGGGAERDSKAAYDLRCGAQGVSFDHVCRDRAGSSTDLIGHPEMAIQWCSKCQPIGGASELLATFPGFQGLELLHV